MKKTKHNKHDLNKNLIRLLNLTQFSLPYRISTVLKLLTHRQAFLFSIALAESFKDVSDDNKEFLAHMKKQKYLSYEAITEKEKNKFKSLARKIYSMNEWNPSHAIVEIFMHFENSYCDPFFKITNVKKTYEAQYLTSKCSFSFEPKTKSFNRIKHFKKVLEQSLSINKEGYDDWFFDTTVDYVI